MSTNRKKPSKVSQLSQVIAVQEKTIQKLQKVKLSHNFEVLGRTNDLNSASVRNRVVNEIKTSQKVQGKKKQKSISERDKSNLSLKGTQNVNQKFLPTFSNHQTEKTSNNKDTDRYEEKSRYEDKSSISRHRDEASVIHEQKMSLYRPQQTFHCNSQNLQQEYQYEIQMLKDKLELFKIEYYAQENLVKRKEKDYQIRILEYEEQNKFKDERINNLNKQLEFQTTEKDILNTEFIRQKTTFQHLYQDFCEEMQQLKEDLKMFSLGPSKSPQKNHYIGDSQRRQNSQFENSYKKTK